MASRAVTYTLFAAIIVSVFINFILYQKTQSLEQISEYFKKQNDELTNRLQSEITSENKIEPKHEVITFPKTSYNVTDSSQSITAVAVRPVLVTDGFFETTRYDGTVMKITVDVRDGKGLALVNTEVPTGVDFQTSAKTAIKVAQKITSVNLSNKDVIFSISSKNNQELQAVDGTSAGAAMAALLASELTGNSINDTVLMTGTIEPDGTIGRVGGVAEKAEAAGKYGAELFLVPEGQAVAHVQSCDEKKSGVFIYRSCTLEEKPLSPIMEQKYDMKVIEISNIEDALSYFAK